MVGGDHTVAVTAGGLLYTWGYGAYGQLGHGDTVNVVTQDGALWACAQGLNGEPTIEKKSFRLSGRGRGRLAARGSWRPRLAARWR